MSSSYPATLENGGHDDIEMANQEGRRSAKNIDPPVTGSWRRVRRLLMSSSCQATSENGGHDDAIVKMARQEGPRSAENIYPPVTVCRRHGGSGLFSRSTDDSGTLVVVTTLITTLSYQVGSNVPGGYWQDDDLGHHRAGEPIMRTQRFSLYMLFILSSWVGFAASMGLTLALLTGMPPGSRFVRGLFVLSYSARPYPQLHHPACLFLLLRQPRRLGRCLRHHCRRRQLPHQPQPPQVHQQDM
ncbi:hypothetical protein BAE44_0011947 [Dichanthelium oligosanthes]|uniref:PGG domain-containing protein n=1 Tax=Dichanthelium oligosanthes TaxID=888268 RepID=A0A1E5VPG5_9POAL|nr:hypothetical protein BAE44_0011947 [Dichanthelium oligosanthes]